MVWVSLPRTGPGGVKGSTFSPFTLGFCNNCATTGGDASGLRQDAAGGDSPYDPMSLPQHVEAFERALIEQALAESGGVINRTMEVLGLPRKTLYDKMQKYGLDKSRYK